MTKIEELIAYVLENHQWVGTDSPIAKLAKEAQEELRDAYLDAKEERND